MKRSILRSPRAIAAAIGLASFATATPAGADEPKDAEALFDEGRKLMKDPARLADACRVLGESYMLVKRGDTLLNLAECHRRERKTALAWAEFDKAIQESEKVGFIEAMQVAKQRRDELAAKLATLIVRVPDTTSALEGLTVEVNGTSWPREQWNKPALLDPGPTEITGAAKGYKVFKDRLEIAAGKEPKTVTVALEREPSPEPPKPPPPPPKRTVVVAERPRWPWIVGGAGLALVGASVGFAVDQRTAGRELDDHCGADRRKCGAFDFAPSRAREIRDFGLFVGLGAAGLVAVGAGGFGLGLAPRGASGGKTSIRIAPASVAVEGEF